MLGILSDNSRTQRIAQHAHQITEAATLIKQLRKRPCSEAWGTCKEPWGFAGSLGCLQRRSYAPTSCTLSMFQSINMLLPALLKNLLGKESSENWQEKSSLASSFAAYVHELSRWPQHYATFSNIELTDTYVLGDTLAITALQTKVTTGRLLLIRIEDHKEHICCLSRCAWLVWAFRVFSMVQRVPTAGCCPTILFGIVTRSLACFCGALGCLVRRLTTLAISAFICPCPKLCIECNLVLRMASRSSYSRSQQFYHVSVQDLFQNQALGNANHEHIRSIMCSLQKE